MKKSHLIEFIEKIAPLSFQAEWDASGVQVASEGDDVTHVAVMLDPSEESVQRALASGADFILAHHPLAMKPRFLNVQDAYFKVVAAVLRQSVCLYSAHTSLDANPQGPVRWLAEALDLQNVEILETTGTSPSCVGGSEQVAPHDTKPASAYGFGFIGDLPTPCSYDDFCGGLGAFDIPRWRACGPLPKTIRRVACCPGSGSGLAPLALEKGADVFITGDMKYHPATEAPLRILDVGHFILEEKMMKLFAEMIKRELNIPVTFIAAADPFHFEGALAEYL